MTADGGGQALLARHLVGRRSGSGHLKRCPQLPVQGEGGWGTFGRGGDGWTRIFDNSLLLRTDGGGDATSEDAEPTSPSGGCSVVDAVQDRSPSSELEHVDAGSPSSELEHGEAAAKRSIPFARAVRTEG